MLRCICGLMTRSAGSGTLPGKIDDPHMILYCTRGVQPPPVTPEVGQALLMTHNTPTVHETQYTHVVAD